MSSATDLTSVIRYLRAPSGEAMGDQVLLERYTRDGDQAAFEALVRRYGALVFGVARRQLADRQRAEDVFQATFLALARSAAKLERQPVLVNWLYTVALRQARKVRARSARQEALERAAPHAPQLSRGGDLLDEITGRELLQTIDDEIARLPERLRLPILLCCTQNLSCADAAQRLGVPVGVVRGRLARGRRKLTARLALRGLAPAALILAPFAAVAVPAELFARAASCSAAPWSKAIPAAVAELATVATPRATLAGAVLGGCVLVAALVGWAVAAERPQPATAPAGAQPVPPGVAVNPEPNEPLPAGIVMQFGSPRFRHTTEIESLAVSPDGKVAVAASGTSFPGTVRAYDLASGRILYTFDSVRDVEAVAFSPDGKLIATRPFATEHRTIYIHDAANGKIIARVRCHCSPDVLEFSPDSKRLLATSADRKALYVADIAKDEVVNTFSHTGVVHAAAFAPDGKHIAGGGYDQEKETYFARLWDAKTGKEVRRFEFGKWGVRSLAFSADSATLALGSDYGQPLAVKLFEVSTGKERRAIPFPGASSVRAVAFSPNGKVLAASGGSSTRLFDTATGKELVKLDRRASGLRFSPDGAALVGAVAGTVYRWDATTGRPLIPEGGESPIRQIAVTPDGKQVVTLCQQGDAHIWDTGTGAHLRRVRMSPWLGFALSPDGRFLVWPEDDERIRYKGADEPNTIHSGTRLRVLDLSAGKTVERFAGFEGGAEGLFFAPDGQALVTVGIPDAQVRIWNVVTGKKARSFSVREPGARVTYARLSPDGKVLAVVYQKPRAKSLNVEYISKVWELASGKALEEKPGHWADREVMALAPDGKTMAVAMHAGSIRFEDVATGRVQKEIRVPHGMATALAFGPHGQLFSGTPEATVLAWDPQSVMFPPAEQK